MRPVKEDRAGRKDNRLKISILAIGLTVFFLIFVYVNVCVSVGGWVFVFICLFVYARISVGTCTCVKCTLVHQRCNVYIDNNQYMTTYM